MRIFPLALIAVGVFGLLKHFGLVDMAFLHLLWPLLLIAIGAALLTRGPRWRDDRHVRMQDRWERRMHRHFGPGWASLSEEERERFRSGMQQWHCQAGDRSGSHAAGQAQASDGSVAKPPTRSDATGGQG